MESSNTKNKTVVWIAVGCLAVLVCILTVIIFAFGGLAWIGMQTPENVNITVNAPLEVNVGDAVEIKVAITNTSTEALQLSSIDISLNYLNGFVINQTEPVYTETGQYNIVGGKETFQSFYFSRQILPGETLTVLFIGKSVTAGDFSGEVDVCIDTDFNCATHIARTIVR